MFPTSVEQHYQQRNRRRGRNDPNNRDYICPCGKCYLSYPALFTHIKTKHNGRVLKLLSRRRLARSSSRPLKTVEEADQKPGKSMTPKAKQKTLHRILWTVLSTLCSTFQKRMERATASRKFTRKTSSTKSTRVSTSKSKSPSTMTLKTYSRTLVRMCCRSFLQKCRKKSMSPTTWT